MNNKTVRKPSSLKRLLTDALLENSTRNPVSNRRRTVSFSGSASRKKEKEEDHAEIIDPEVFPEDPIETRVRETFQEHSRRKHSVYSFTADLPDGALKVRAFFQKLALALWNHSDTCWARVFSWLILTLLLWLMMYTIMEDNMGPQGDLFRLFAMIICAYLAGMVVEKILKVPALLGMLVTGCVLRNVGFYHPAKGPYMDFTRTLKQLATTVGMVRAGMRLVPDAIYAALHCHQGIRLAGLGMVPSFLEAMVTTIVAYLALGYPPVWAVCLGFLLCPNSPSVITPPMAELMEAGYGEEKHIGVLVHGAAGLDVAFSVSIFDICLAMLFHGRDLHPAHMVGLGSLDVLVDIFGGFLLGLIAGFLPVQDDKLAVWKRAAAVMAGGMMAIVCGPKVGLPGTGPLSSICTAFVASMLWKLQAPLSSKNTVNEIMQGAWVVLCPMLFAFTGSDVDLSALDWISFSWMLGIVLLTVLVRLIGCFLVLCGGEFNWKEMLFVGLIFQGKATNQAALAPQILYAAWISSYPDDNVMADQAVTMGAMSILICTPLAHLGAKLGGPYLLQQRFIPQPSPTRGPTDQAV